MPVHLWQEEFEEIGDIRGVGCMTGIEFVTDKKSKSPNARLVSDIVIYCAEHGLIVECAGTYSNVIRFLCPLVVTDEQLDCGLEILYHAVKDCR